jgi:hypothetical protein
MVDTGGKHYQAIVLYRHFFFMVGENKLTTHPRFGLTKEP